MKVIEFKSPENELFIGAKKLIQKINSLGYHAYIVGGAIRNLLVGKEVKDIDIVCDANIEELIKIFPNSKCVGASFGVIIEKVDKFSYEIASCREEREYLDGRHPEFIKFTKDFEVDSKRRDLTINALLFDPIAGEVIDYNNGLDDLKNNIIRTVGVAKKRFNEDYLRMLRAVRFATILDFTLDYECQLAIEELAYKSELLSCERIKSELDQMLISKNPAKSFEMLSELGVLKYILPELDELKGVQQSPIYHPEGDVFEHTMLMLRHMKRATVNLGWSVLLHDVGKKVTQSQDESGFHFYSHEVASLEIATIVLERFKFSKSSSQKILQAVANHMRFANIPQMKESKVLKIIGDKNFGLELELNRLDCISCHKFMDSFNFLLWKLVALKGKEILPKKLITGKLLLQLGFTSGPEFSNIIKAGYEAQLNNEFRTCEESEEWLKKNYQALMRKEDI